MTDFVSQYDIGQHVIVDGDVTGIITAIQFQKHDHIIRVAIWNNSSCTETWFEDWRIDHDPR